MVLGFTLGAGLAPPGEQVDARDLLIAALGCNTAWGIIDAALYLIDRLSERGRIHRLVRRVQASASREAALALVTRELDRRIPAFVERGLRTSIDADGLEHAREVKLGTNRLTGADAWAALAVFWLVFLTTLPAALPLLVLGDAWVALRVSNALLIGLLFYAGWRWAGYTGSARWSTGLVMALLGVALVGGRSRSAAEPQWQGIHALVPSSSAPPSAAGSRPGRPPACRRTHPLR